MTGATKTSPLPSSDPTEVAAAVASSSSEMVKPISTAYVLSFRGRFWDTDHEYYSLLCNLTFVESHTANDGPIKGTLSAYHTKDVTMVLRGDLRLLPHSKWTRDPDTGVITIALHIFIESVEGTEALSHITVRTEGIYSNRRCSGTYDVYHAGKVVEDAPWPQRSDRHFTLHEVTQLFCCFCFREIFVDEPPKCLTCRMTQYCSDECRSKDAQTPQHAEICRVASSAIGSFTVLVVSYESRPFVIMLRAAGEMHVVFVDARNPATGRMYYFALGVFEDKRMDQALMDSAGYSTVMRQDVAILDQVTMWAISSQQTGLATACLHALHRDGHHMEQLERLYAMYYEFILCAGPEVELRQVNTLEEYIVMARPLYEYSTVLLEGALKSRLPSEFWARIDIARNIAIQLFNSNNSAKFPHELMTEVVAHQQRQVLHLLAKIFISMAARLPQPRADDMLRRAIECYVDAIEDPLLHGSVLDLARTHLRLSCVHLMRCTQDAESVGCHEDFRARAMKERQVAFQLLDRHYSTVHSNDPILSSSNVPVPKGGKAHPHAAGAAAVPGHGFPVGDQGMNHTTPTANHNNNNTNNNNNSNNGKKANNTTNANSGPTTNNSKKKKHG